MLRSIRTLLLLTVFFYSSQSFSQSLTQTVKGKVIDSQSEEPMIGVNIVLIDTTQFLAGSTDMNGDFSIANIPVGRASFVVTSIGYENYVVSEILVGSAKEVYLTVRMVEKFQQLEGATIVANKTDGKPNNDASLISSRSFSVEETKRFPASISDPGRMALSYAGVSGGDDETNEIIIRGNAPNQLLWRVEGMEVPDPNHFSEAGFSTGAISILNTNILAKSDFFTGAFPAEYGNAISGVFDIKLRNGNSDKREYAFQLGVLGTDLTAEGPFSKNYRGSYLVNYRYSTLSLLGDIIDLGDGTIPTFQDGSFKVNLPIGGSSNLSFWGITGFSEDNSEERQFGDTIYSEIFESKTYMSGLTFMHFFDNNSKIETRFSVSGNSSDYIENVEFQNINHKENETNISKNKSIRFNTDYSKKFNGRTSLKIGATYSLIDYNIESFEELNGVKNIYYEAKGDGAMFQSFVQVKHRFSENVTSVFGVHQSYFSVNDKTVIEPRAGLEWKLNPKHTLSAGFGIHSRRLGLTQYFVQTLDENNSIVTPNKDLDFMQATHYIVGYDWRVIKNGHFKIEAYYQDLNKVGIPIDITSTDATVNGEVIEFELEAKGKGRNYGLEFTFEKFFSNQYYFLSTLSIYDSKYKASNGKWYNTEFNSNYSFNFVGGKEFTKGKEGNNILGFNAKVITSGGQRGTPVDLDYFAEFGELHFDESERNTIQFKGYFRIDASVYFRLNKPKVSHIFSLDIQNLTDHSNIAFQFIDPATQEERTYYQLGLVPIFNYKLEF